MVLLMLSMLLLKSDHFNAVNSPVLMPMKARSRKRGSLCCFLFRRLRENLKGFLLSKYGFLCKWSLDSVQRHWRACMFQVLL